MINTSMRVCNTKAKAELCWQPSMPSYREGVGALAGEARPANAPDSA